MFKYSGRLRHGWKSLYGFFLFQPFFVYLPNNLAYVLFLVIETFMCSWFWKKWSRDMPHPNNYKKIQVKNTSFSTYGLKYLLLLDCWHLGLVYRFNWSLMISTKLRKIFNIFCSTQSSWDTRTFKYPIILNKLPRIN